MRTWTDHEVRILTENYNSVTNSQLSALIPEKTPLAIYKKAYKMGLRKTSEITYLNRSESRQGENSQWWKGGVSSTAKGYRQLKIPDHHRADSKGYVMEHIVIFEEATGIKVPEHCCVHHINGDKTDNRIENLCMMTHASHTALHNRIRKGDKHNEL